MSDRPRLKADDTEPLAMRAYGPNGEVVDLSGGTLDLGARRTLSSPLVHLQTTPIDLTQGTFYWARQAGELTPGCWRMELLVTRDGQQVTFPSNMPGQDYYEVDIVANANTGVTP